MNAKQLLTALMLFGILSIGSSTFSNVSAQMAGMTNHMMIAPGDLKWVPASPALPQGAMVAVIEGDPKLEGMFTMRLKFPANYKIMPHWHPADERITVLEGSLYMGAGEKFDESMAKEIPAGGFGKMSAEARHYAYTKNGCTIQLNGVGPWVINYSNPADDPRHKK